MGSQAAGSCPLSPGRACSFTPQEPPNTTRTPRAAPRILLTRSRLQILHKLLPLPGVLSTSSPSGEIPRIPQGQSTEGGREGGTSPIRPRAQGHAVGRGALLTVSPPAARAPTTECASLAHFTDGETLSYLFNVPQWSATRTKSADTQTSPVHAPLALGAILTPERGLLSSFSPAPGIIERSNSPSISVVLRLFPSLPW